MRRRSATRDEEDHDADRDREQREHEHPVAAHRRNHDALAIRGPIDDRLLDGRLVHGRRVDGRLVDHRLVDGRLVDECVARLIDGGVSRLGRLGRRRVVGHSAKTSAIYVTLPS
jgi:hypothetical protein